MNIVLSQHFTYKKLMKFTIPTIIMMIFTSIYGVVDGLFISNFVGSNSFAAVNLIMPALMILGSIGFMVGTGGGALVSKTMGEGKNKEANEYFSLLIYSLIIAGIIFSIVGIFFIEDISMLFGADESVIDECITYGRTLLVFLTPFMLQNCFQSFLIVAEKPTFGLEVSIVAGISNILLDYLFIYVFKMGVFGAALATGISQIIGALIPFTYFLHQKENSLKLTKTKFKLWVINRSCINGLSEMLSNICTSIVNILYNIKLMEYAGADGVVSYGIIMYISFIFSGTYMGYSLGTAPIVGYHYGANDKNELKNLLKKSIKLITIISISMTLAAEILSKLLATIFVSYDIELLDMTTNAIMLFSASYLISGFNIFASSFFTALNDGVYSTIISFLRTLVFQVAMIFILPAIWELNGIWLSVVFAEILSLIVSVSFVISKRKKYGYM